MNNKASVIVNIMVFLVIIVITSGILLLLLNVGVLKTKTSTENVLNTEFLPGAREGTLGIASLQLCADVVNYECIIEKDYFFTEDTVYFLAKVQTTSYNGEIQLIENYRLLSPSEKILVDADKKDNFHYALASNQNEEVVITDSFSLGGNSEVGEYSLEFVIENPLLGKEITITRTFTADVFEEEG